MTALLWFLLVLVILVYLWSRWIEPYFYEISRHQVHLRKPLARPLRMLHLSDTHFARENKRKDALFDELAKEEVDFVVISGDIVDCEKGIPHCVKNLSKLKPSHGIFAVLGNHDYFDYRLWDCFIHNFPGQSYPKHHQHVYLLEDALMKASVTVLKNETREVNFYGTPILMHGLDDPATGRANLRITMKKFDSKKINLLLTHTIDVFLDIGEGEIDMSFSGHSHGGQVRLPFYGPILTHTMMGRSYASGLFRHKGAICSVSRGISQSRFTPVRLLCRPEAVLFEVQGR